MGDDITPALDERTLVIANHQSTSDVPLLMATFNVKKGVLPNIMWIMDRLFKYTNFGAVSLIHQDFFIASVSIVECEESPKTNNLFSGQIKPRPVPDRSQETSHPVVHST